MPDPVMDGLNPQAPDLRPMIAVLKARVGIEDRLRELLVQSEAVARFEAELHIASASKQASSLTQLTEIP